MRQMVVEARGSVPRGPMHVDILGVCRRGGEPALCAARCVVIVIVGRGRGPEVRVEDGFSQRFVPALEGFFQFSGIFGTVRVGVRRVRL